MKNVIFLGSLAVCAALTISAEAEQFNLASGNYSDSKRYNGDDIKDAKLKIAQRGNNLRVVDSKNNIIYAVDLGRTDEQPVNPKLLELLRNNPGSRVIGHLIERMTISDVQTSATSLKVKFNLYLRAKSVFGAVSAKLQVGAQVDNERCEIIRYDSGPNFNYKETPFQGTCLTTESGTSLELVELNTGLSPELNRAMGLIGDLTMKLFSPMLSSTGNLYEMR